MTAGKGALLMIKVGDGATPTEGFTTVGGLRTTRFQFNSQLVDASHVESGQWRAAVAAGGASSLRLSGTGIFMDSAAEETVRSYAFGHAVHNYQLVFPNNDKIAGAFKITEYAREADFDDVEMYRLTLESAGTITYTQG